MKERDDILKRIPLYADIKSCDGYSLRDDAGCHYYFSLETYTDMLHGGVFAHKYTFNGSTAIYDGIMRYEVLTEYSTDVNYITCCMKI